MKVKTRAARLMGKTNDAVAGVRINPIHRRLLGGKDLKGEWSGGEKAEQRSFQGLICASLVNPVGTTSTSSPYSLWKQGGNWGGRGSRRYQKPVNAPSFHRLLPSIP